MNHNANELNSLKDIFVREFRHVQKWKIISFMEQPENVWEWPLCSRVFHSGSGYIFKKKLFNKIASKVSDDFWVSFYWLVDNRSAFHSIHKFRFSMCRCQSKEKHCNSMYHEIVFFSSFSSLSSFDLIFVLSIFLSIFQQLKYFHLRAQCSLMCPVYVQCTMYDVQVLCGAHDAWVNIHSSSSVYDAFNLSECTSC